MPEVKIVNAEFYEGVMDCLLKCIHRVCPAAFCSQDFFLLHDNAPAHKAASVCQLKNQKNVTTLYHPPPFVLTKFISARLFSVPQVENEVKGLHFADVAEIQEAVSDELKKVQEEEISAAFQQLYDRAEVCIYAKGAYLELKKKGVCLPQVSSIFKKISPKTFGPHGV
jgi:hypothetical protein